MFSPLIGQCEKDINEASLEAAEEKKRKIMRNTKENSCNEIMKLRKLM